MELSERSLFFMSLTTKERGSLCSGGDWKEQAGDKDDVLAGDTAERDAVLPGETVETSSESANEKRLVYLTRQTLIWKTGERVHTMSQGKRGQDYANIRNDNDTERPSGNNRG